MQLPPSVRRVIEERADAVGFPALKLAAAALSEAYRDGRPGALSRVSAAQRTAAYLVTRMPATYAAAFHVLKEVSSRIEVKTILDVGAGTGAASLAATHFFPEARITMLERDAAFAEVARVFLPEAAMLNANAATLDPIPPHDVILAVYSLGELDRPLAQRLWHATRVALIVIEPGTPTGFALVRSIRDGLLSAGAHMLAPCPAQTPCPMVDPDWCHFAARVERSSLHRRLKEAQLNYEDEKFSYIALSRTPAALPEARIIRHPQHNPGLITLETCTPAGLQKLRITKRHKEGFRQARKSSWGEAFHPY